MTPLISVIMPVFNTKLDFLCEAIDSILSQTLGDFEFIIINDGSTNIEIETTICSYKDKRIKYFFKENTGVADTLNFGLSKANGKYIARMDSDDISIPYRFEKQVSFLEEHHEISLVGSWVEFFPNNEIWKTMVRPQLFDFLTGPQLAHPTVMFRKSDFDRYNFKYDPSYQAEDYELWSRVAKKLGIDNIQEVLLKYRITNEQVTSRNKSALDKNALVIQEKIAKQLTPNPIIQQGLLNLIKKENKKPTPFDYILNRIYNFFANTRKLFSKGIYSFKCSVISLFRKRKEIHLSTIDIDDKPILNELKELGEFSYMPNSGNMGDALIASATMNWFERNNLKYSRTTATEFPEKFVYGGGGAWIHTWINDMKPVMEKMTRAEKVIILPSSFNNVPEFINILDDRFVVFCREKKSYNYLLKQNTKAKILLDHDMALRLPNQLNFKIIPPYNLRKQTLTLNRIVSTLQKDVCLFRKDSESCINKDTDLDLSDSFGVFSNYETKETLDFAANTMLNIISSFEKITTDRLHVAISGTLLNKEVFLYDNSYNKCSEVYNQSLQQFKNINFINGRNNNE